MDLNPTAEQRMLIESARAFLTRSCPLTLVRAMEADPRGFSPELWGEMSALGWVGMTLPEECGGGGGSFLDLVLLCEELGRFLLPSPLLASSVLAAPLLDRLGTVQQRARWLPELAAGRAIATLALVEPGQRDEWGRIGLRAGRRNGQILLSGTKLFVPFAAAADLILVATRLDGADLSLALVEPGAHGVDCTRLATLDGGHRYEVTFAGAPAADLIVDPALRDAIESTLLRAAVTSVAYATGAASRALEMTLDYAKTRNQFDRPIGSFQAVAHRCVDMRSDIDALRVLVHQAAWSLSEGRRSDLEVGAAKAYGNEALRRIFMNAHQVHGAIAFSTECDLQLFTRRAKVAELDWGSATFHRERVARAMGLG